MTLSAAEAQRIFAAADLVVSEQDAALAVRRVAGEIADALSASHPLVLSVMGGAVIFTGQLLPLLRFPLEFDYLHVTRYGRTVLVLDDILDEGITLAAIKRRLLEQGAKDCRIAVFADKDLGREKPVRADFTGVHLPNRYVFGFGMDVKGAWRNLPAVYAVRES